MFLAVLSTTVCFSAGSSFGCLHIVKQKSKHISNPVCLVSLGCQRDDINRLHALLDMTLSCSGKTGAIELHDGKNVSDEKFKNVFGSGNNVSVTHESGCIRYSGLDSCADAVHALRLLVENAASAIESSTSHPLSDSYTTSKPIEAHKKRAGWDISSNLNGSPGGFFTALGLGMGAVICVFAATYTIAKWVSNKRARSRSTYLRDDDLGLLRAEDINNITVLDSTLTRSDVLCHDPEQGTMENSVERSQPRSSHSDGMHQHYRESHPRLAAGVVRYHHHDWCSDPPKNHILCEDIPTHTEDYQMRLSYWPRKEFHPRHVVNKSVQRRSISVDFSTDNDSEIEDLLVY